MQNHIVPLRLQINLELKCMPIIVLKYKVRSIIAHSKTGHDVPKMYDGDGGPGMLSSSEGISLQMQTCHMIQDAPHRTEA